MKEYLPETASQTAGPYVHIGLAPDAAGFHIFEKNFGPVLTTADTVGAVSYTHLTLPTIRLV